MSRRGTVRRDPATGRWGFVVDVALLGAPRRQIRRRGFPTRRQAQRELDRLKADIDRGEHVERSRETVGLYLQRWLPAIRATVEATTWESYQRNLDNHVIPRIGDLRLQQLAPTDLSALYATLLESGRRDGRGGLSPRTVRYIASIIHRALREAAGEGLIARNPAQHAKIPGKKSRRTRPPATWTAHELRRFLALVAEERLAPVFHLAAMTGMRRGEILALRWRDLDLDAGRVTVVRQLRTVRHTPQLADLKTDRSRRAVDLDPATIALLRAHRKAQAEERLLVGAGYQDQDLVFARLDGCPYQPEAVAKVFERRVARSKLPRIRFHDLRHTWATLALHAGVHPKVVSDRLGHASVAFTLDIYSHVLQSLDADAASKVAALVLGADNALRRQ